ncbi:hypothetical protein LMG24076_00001 [Trinickia soli]|nr:hypothetical protein LMG24076_00001 [Trinickia soli]
MVSPDWPLTTSLEPFTVTDALLYRSIESPEPFVVFDCPLMETVSFD